MYGFYLFFQLIMNYQYAYFLSYTISVIALYFMNVLVFKESVSLHTVLIFPFIYALQYLLGAGALALFVHLGIPTLFAPILVVIMLFPVTFIFNKLIFK